MSDTPEIGVRCRAFRKDGTPCRAKAIRNGLCFAHDPANGRENRAKGGRASSNAERSLKRLPARLRPVADLLTRVMVETYRGELTPAQASSIASVASALVRVVQAGELEQRVQELEELIASRTSA